MKKIVFLCIHNSGRSQMAEAFFNDMAGGKALAVSAGTAPAKQINPAVVQAMQEIGIDMSKQYPKVLTFDMLKDAEKAITMGCNIDEGICPASFIQSEDWAIEDPAGKPIEKVRQIRDIIKIRVEKLVQSILEEKP